MTNYYNENGEIYTMQEVEEAAKEHNKTVDEIISVNGLSTEPPKKKTVARKKLPDTANNDAVAVSNTKASSKKNTVSKSTSGSLDSQKKQSKVKKMPELEEGFDLGLGKQKQDQPSILTEQQQKQKALAREAKTALPLMQKRKKIREAKTAEELTSMKSDVLEVSKADQASLDALQAEINKNKEAKELLANAPQLSAEAIATIDEDINNKRKTDGEAYYETPGYKPGMIIGGLGPAIGTTPTTRYRNNFEKEKNQVIAELKRDGLFESTSKGEILDRAAKLAKKNAILAAKESLWRDYLENNTDIDVKTKNLLKDYTSLKGSVAQTNLAKNMMLIEDTVKAGDVLYKEFLEAQKGLKPKDYKFTSQEELDSEIEKINSINSKIAKLKDYDLIIKKYGKDNKKNNKDIEDAQFEFDMLKRDYTYGGTALKFGDTVKSWSLDLLGFANLISAIPEAQFKLIMPDDLVEEFESTNFSAKGRAVGLSEEKRRIEKYIEGHYAKSRGINDMESFMENTWESFSRFAPDLALMYLTGGGSKVAQKVAQEGSETFLKSAFKKLAPTKTSLSIGARVAGSENLAMTDEMKNGYYDEDGNFFKPEYNDLQLIAVPLLKGYVEGKFEEVTQNIFEKGGRFFNSVANNEPQKWYNFTKYATKDLVKKAGLEYLTSQVEEGSSEVLTTWANNVIDVTLLGKDKNIFEGTGETLKESFLLTNVLSGVPHVGGLMIRPFMPVTNAETLSTNATKMSEILDKLKDKNLTELQKTDLENQLATLRKSSNNIINSTVSNISDMPSASFEFVNNAVDAMAALKSQAREIDQREDITPEEKAESIKALRVKYNENAADLNTLMSRFSSTKFYNKAFNSADKRKVLGLITEAFQAQKQLDQFTKLGDQASADSARNGIKAIEKELDQIYKENDVDLNKERATEFDENLKTVKKIAGDNNITVIEAQNEEDMLNKISENKLPLTGDQKALAAKSTGFNYIHPDNGKEFIIINRQTAVEKNYVNTAAHELLHSMISAGLGRSSSRIPLAKELLVQLIKMDRNKLEGSNLFSRLEKYETQGTEIQAEEVLTLFSDALASGSIKYNETVFTKIGDYIRRFLQDVFGYSISFNDGRDVYNFIKDYNKSIVKGELTKSQKNIFKSGIGGKLVTDKKNITPTGEIKASLTQDEYNEAYNNETKKYDDALEKLEDQLANGEIDEDGFDQKADKLEREYNKKIAALKAEIEESKTSAAQAKVVEQKPLLGSEVDPNAELKAKIKAIDEEYADLDAKLNILPYGSKEYIDADKRAAELEDEKSTLEFELKRVREIAKAIERKKEIAEKKKFSKKQKQFKESDNLPEYVKKEAAIIDAIGNKGDKVDIGDPMLIKILEEMILRKINFFRTKDDRLINLADGTQGGIGGINVQELVTIVKEDLLLTHINRFDKNRNDSLYGYINNVLMKRLYGALGSKEATIREHVGNIDERKQGGETDYYEGTGERSDAGLAYDAYSDESSYDDNIYPSRPTYKPLLKVNMFHPNTIERFKKSLIPVVGTLKTKINQPITPNKKVSDFINEILNDVKENNWGDLPSGEGIRTAMGSTNELFKKWLIKNKKAILENMTTTYLMGKDKGIDKDGVPQVDGGIPVAIQKRVDGVWLSFPDWVGKKIDREDVKTDLAGRTAGHIIVRRLPDVSLNVPDDVFLSYFIRYDYNNKLERIPDRDKNLAKQIAGELALELISEDFITGGILYQALEKNQMRLGAAIERLTTEEFNRQAERGNIKFSQAEDAYVTLKDSKFVLDIALQDPEFNKIWNESDMDGFAKLNISQLSLKLQKLSGDRKKKDGPTIKIDSKVSEPGKIVFSLYDDNLRMDKAMGLLPTNSIYMSSNIRRVISQYTERSGGKLKVNLPSMNANQWIKFLEDPNKNGGIKGVNQEIKYYDLGKKLNDYQEREKLKSLSAEKVLEVYNSVKISDPGFIRSDQYIDHVLFEDGYVENVIVQETDDRYPTVFSDHFSFNRDDLNSLLWVRSGTFDVNIKNAKGRVFFVHELQSDQTQTYRKLGLGNESNFDTAISNTNDIIDHFLTKAVNFVEKHREIAYDFASEITDYINENLPNYFISSTQSIEEQSTLISGIRRIQNKFLAKFNGSKIESEIIEGIDDISEVFKNNGKFYNGLIKLYEKNMSFNPEMTQERLKELEKIINSSGINNLYIDNNTNSFSDILDNIVKNAEKIQAINNNIYPKLLDFKKETGIAQRNKDLSGILYKDTKQFVKTGLKTALSLAVQNESDYLVINNGDLITKVTPTASEENDRGLAKFYDEFIPSVLKDALKDLDPNAKMEQIDFSEMDLSKFKTQNKGLEFGTHTAVKITPKLVEELKYGQVPLFSMTDDNTYKSTVISDFLNSQKTKSISGVASLAIIEEFRQSIENYWGKIPDTFIDWMYRSAEYTNDVIEDRLNNESDMMGFLNGALNYQALQNLNDTVNKELSKLDPNNQDNIKFSLQDDQDEAISYEFNAMLERKTGAPAKQEFGDLEAKRLGKKSNRFYWFMAPGVDDFEGLTSYMFAGTGFQGLRDKQFFEKYLIKPYLNALNKLDIERNIIKKSYEQLLNSNKEIAKKLEKEIPAMPGYTYDQAIRVFLWDIAGYEIPGLTTREIRNIKNTIRQDPELVKFANSLAIIGRDQNKGWIAPDTYWNAHTILSDLYRITEGQLRTEFLSDFINNADIIFSKENLNKVQAVMGDKVRYALEDALRRMKTGSNSPQGTGYDKNMSRVTSWLNGATASIMFLNMRSALLQLTSIPNFLNADFNNPLKVLKAIKDVKQYSEDFLMLFNSPKLLERRNGLKADVTSSEIAAAAGEKNKVMGIISLLLKKGFLPTQIADSISICTLGATYYRNLVNKLMLDNPKWEKETAEREAMKAVSARIEKMMQSSDPMFVSQQQSSVLGRSILTFGNASMQYQRLIAKAASDIKNRRGSVAKNVARILYYGAIQNAVFTAAQQMLFGTYFWAAADDDDEAKKLQEKAERAYGNFYNSMADSLLRGSGIYGALISMVKNTAMVLMEQEGIDLTKEFKDMPIQEELDYEKEKSKKRRYADYVEVGLAMANLSPPVGSKLRKLYSFKKQGEIKADVIKARGWDLTAEGKLNPGPNYKRYGNLVEAITNVPLGRIATKLENLASAVDSQNSNAQRVLSALGWGNYELGIEDKVDKEIKEKAIFERKVESAKSKTKSSLQKKEDEKKLIDSLGGKAAYFEYKRSGVKTDEEIEKEKIKAAAKGYDYDKMQKMSKSELLEYKREIDRGGEDYGKTGGFNKYYINEAGVIYSIEEIKKVAEDQKTVPQDIININNLKRYEVKKNR